ncbi:MAG TPA: TRAP transporter small permease subunit [Anaerovoracaceae bacterium]|nr:TRAP transporter small permease subunit [Anaerovoracaceae bacterium]
MLENVRKKLDKAVTVVAGSFFALAVLATLLGMVDRTFGLGWKIVWAEEVTGFSMTWSMFTIMGLCLRTGYHSAFTLILDVISEKKKIVLNMIILLLVSLLFAIFLIYGLTMAISNAHQLSAVLQMSMFFPYFAIPVGALLTLFETFTAMYENIKDWKTLKIEGVR